MMRRTTRQPRWLCYSIEPIHCFQQPPKLWIICGERGQPFPDWFPFPPRFLATRRELITIKSRANVMRRRVGKGIVCQERECAAIVVQKFPYKMQRPRIFCGRRHRCEPDLPVDPWLIRRDERRPAVRITRFSFELVFLPFRIAGDYRLVRSLKNNLVAFAPDGAKCPVSVY